MALPSCHEQQEFGHLKCKVLASIPVEKFKKDIDTNSVYKKLVMLKERQLCRPLYYQVMKTMFAAILFKAGTETKYDSLLYLTEVIKDDETNITAIADLEYIHEYMNDLKIAGNYRQKLESIVSRQDNMALARAYYDQAHIIRHFEQDKRQFSYFDLLKKAKYHIELVNDTECSIETERGEILFDYSLSLYRKYSQKVEFGIMEELELQNATEIFQQAIDSFLDVINITESPSDCKALSYIFIAILLRLKDKFDEDNGETIPYVNKRLTDVLKNKCFETNLSLDRLRSECLEMGLLLEGDDSNVLRRIASEYIHLNKLQEAEELFTKSLLKEESWFAYRHQGLLYLKMYDVDKSDHRLTNAKHSFENAFRIKNTHADLSDIGYIYMLQGEIKQKSNDQTAISYLNKAKMTFADAVKLTDCDDYFNPIKTYERWGYCLQLTDENLGIGNVRKMSDDCEERLRVDCNFVAANVSEQLGATKTSERPIDHDFYVIASPVDNDWVVKQILPKLEGEYKLKGFRKERDTALGTHYISVWVEALCTSKFIVIVLSTNFQNCPWCKYELNLALNSAIRKLPKYIVIPIMRQECQAPVELQPFCERNLIETSDDIINDSGWNKFKNVLDN